MSVISAHEAIVFQLPFHYLLDDFILPLLFNHQRVDKGWRLFVQRVDCVALLLPDSCLATPQSSRFLHSLSYI